jgi:hypothetical protein
MFIYIYMSDVQVIFRQTERFEVFPSAGMVGKQGVAAPVSCRFWISGTAVLYMSACASLCKRQPTIIYIYNSLFTTVYDIHHSAFAVLICHACTDVFSDHSHPMLSIMRLSTRFGYCNCHWYICTGEVIYTVVGEQGKTALLA